MIKTVWCVTFQVSNLEKAGGVEIGLVPKLKEGEKVNASSPSVKFLVDDVEKFYNELKNKRVKFIKELHEEPW
ncbi:hypothetical protein J7L49_01275, partial [Candidatus Bathyarchaeota archaeon]|nr:hypothetical protein [Candidatus Bathyarchaeota archaeon]